MVTSVGLTLIAALLAVMAAVAKLASPRTAVQAMRGAGLASSVALVRAGALVELALGVVVLTGNEWLPRALLALTFLCFAAFALLAIRSGTPAPCGCFGAGGRDVGWRHVGTDLVLAAGLGVSAATGAPGAPQLIDRSAVLGVATAVVAAIGALLAAAYLAGAAATLGARLDA